MNILGYFNLDMTGYLTPGDEIHFCLIYPGGALTLADYFVNVCDIYFPSIPVTRHANLPWGDSDHTSFNQKGYKGIWWFEDINCDSPYIHYSEGGGGNCGNSCTGTIPCLGDRIGPSVNNPEQVTAFTQALVASIATLAEFVGEAPPPLSAPKNCVAEYLDEMNIKVTWEAPTTNTPDEYYVYRDEIKIGEVEDLFFIDTVDDFEEYCYTIKAKYEAGLSIASNRSCTSVPPPFFPPPINCLASYLEDNLISITWTMLEKFTPDGFYIFRDEVNITNDLWTSMLYIDEVGDNEEHCYTIIAVYGANESAHSNKSCDFVPVGIVEYKSNIKIYPNPTTGELRITSNELQVTSVEVFDVYGKKQKAESRKEKGESILNISNLPNGAYFLQIHTEDGKVTKKIIKN
jgi:hypothetical protein